jgi:hypothetical protein
MKEVEKREELKKQHEEQREEEGFANFVAEATQAKYAPFPRSHACQSPRGIAGRPRLYV